MESKYKAPKERQRAEWASYPENLSLRVHPSLSRLDRAEPENNPDSCSSFLCIAFNVACAPEIDDRAHCNERALFNGFLGSPCGLDGKKRLDQLRRCHLEHRDQLRPDPLLYNDLV